MNIALVIILLVTSIANLLINRDRYFIGGPKNFGQLRALVASFFGILFAVYWVIRWVFF